jgi:hypothetical protein
MAELNRNTGTKVPPVMKKSSDCRIWRRHHATGMRIRELPVRLEKLLSA